MLAQRTFTLAQALANIDVKAFFERQGAVVSGKPTNSREGREYSASCPVCGGVDRFKFWPDTGRWNCIRGCGIHGSSVYWWCCDVLKLNHHQACEELGIDPADLEYGGSTKKVILPLYLTNDDPPCKKWMEAAHAFCQRAEKYLWTSAGESTREYLHSRGLKDETIKNAHIGYCPRWYKEELVIWGLSPEQLGREDDPMIKVPEGIVLPWFVNGDIWKVSIRRPDGNYFQVLGSSDALYNVDTLKPGSPAMLFEGEFDALSAQQEAGDLVACVATGSSVKGQTPRWVARLLLAQPLFLAFDKDDAGEKGAAEWLKKCTKGKAYRWTPWAHDCNDMLKQQQPIRLWVETGLQLVQRKPEEQKKEIALPACIVAAPWYKPGTTDFHQIEKQAYAWVFEGCTSEEIADSDLTRYFDPLHFAHYPERMVKWVSIQRDEMQFIREMRLQKEDPQYQMEQAHQLLRKIQKMGCSLRIREEDGIWGIGVPEAWSDNQFQALKMCVDALNIPLRQLVGKRTIGKETSWAKL